MLNYKTDNYNPDYVIHPGATLTETLDVLGMTQAELAKRTSRPEKTISEIINGQTAITPETALQFELALGVPAPFWNALEKNYREIKARLDAKQSLLNEYHATRQYSYKLMSDYDWVPVTQKIEERAENLLRFFGVTSLSVIPKLAMGAFRQIRNDGYSKENLVSWIRQGDREAKDIETKPFDRKKLLEALPKLRALTLSPDGFGNAIQKLCADCGVAVVFVPHLPKTYVVGATRWVSPDKALLQMSVRGVFSDIFWFTFFHELGHILLHKKRQRFIDFKKRGDSVEELEADAFASELLIPQKDIDNFIETEDVTKESIIVFAKQTGIHPGIVLGRLQHMKVLGFNEHIGLKGKYKMNY